MEAGSTEKVNSSMEAVEVPVENYMEAVKFSVETSMEAFEYFYGSFYGIFYLFHGRRGSFRGSVHVRRWKWLKVSVEAVEVSMEAMKVSTEVSTSFHSKNQYCRRPRPPEE